MCLTYYINRAVEVVKKKVSVIKKFINSILPDYPKIKEMESLVPPPIIATDAIGKCRMAMIIEALRGVLVGILADHPQSPLRQLEEKIIRDSLMFSERLLGRQPDEKKIDETVRGILDNPLRSLIEQPGEEIIKEVLAEILSNRPQRKLGEENVEENKEIIQVAQGSYHLRCYLL